MAIKRIGKGFDFRRQLQEFNQFKLTAPKVIAENSKNHYLEGFRKGGGQTDESKTGWEPRQKNVDPGRGILIGKGSGALRRSITVLKSTWREIIIGTQRIAYAERHNEGLSGMPQREFIGNSKDLNEKNKKILVNLLNKIFK